MNATTSFRKVLVLVALGLAAGCSSQAPAPQRTAAAPPATPKAIPESRIGLRTADVLATSKVPPIEPVTAEPGEAPLPQRPYPSSPPVIPHSVDGLLPITASENACLGCHDPANAGDSGATPIPASHRPGGKLDGRRYLCVFCHVPQTKATPLVENQFQP